MTSTMKEQQQQQQKKATSRRVRLHRKPIATSTRRAKKQETVYDRLEKKMAARSRTVCHTNWPLSIHGEHITVPSMSFKKAMKMLGLEVTGVEDSGAVVQEPSELIMEAGDPPHSDREPVIMDPPPGRTMDDVIYREEDQRKQGHDEFDKHTYSHIE